MAFCALPNALWGVWEVSAGLRNGTKSQGIKQPIRISKQCLNVSSADWSKLDTISFWSELDTITNGEPKELLKERINVSLVTCSAPSLKLNPIRWDMAWATILYGQAHYLISIDVVESSTPRCMQYLIYNPLPHSMYGIKYQTIPRTLGRVIMAFTSLTTYATRLSLTGFCGDWVEAKTRI